MAFFVNVFKCQKKKKLQIKLKYSEYNNFPFLPEGAEFAAYTTSPFSNL